MQSVLNILEVRISEVMGEVSGQKSVALVRPATDARFGDYQINGVMPLAKQLKTNPRKLAEQIVAKLDISDICETPGIAGPGFINLRLKPELVAANLLQISKDVDRLGLEKAEKPQTIVVDFSGPNIAKQMHVGHLRSTIIGDSICRLLELQGNKVIRQNHIGDWGTALGKVILGLWHMCMDERIHNNKLYYKTELLELKDYAENKEKLKILCQNIRKRHEKDWEEDREEKRGDGKKHFGRFLDDLKNREDSAIWDKITILYQYVNLLEESLVGMGLVIPTRVKKKSYNKDEDAFEYTSIPYEALSRHITAMMQNIDDEDNKQEKYAWGRIIEISLKYCHDIYRILNVKLSREDVRGESFYRDRLPEVVEVLKKLPETRVSDGAVCVFPDGFKDKESKPLPVIVQKSDGAYLYATTDLAAIRYRVGELKADKIIYVTDARQGLHFDMVFKVAEMAGWAKRDMLHHITFGSVLGDDGKPLKTRSGENVKLKELLDEAIERARKVVEEKNPDLCGDEKEKVAKKDQIAKAVGIGAVKYADYTNNRTSDYIFSFDKMLAMEGNTAPYMQYAYARIKSIKRKATQNDPVAAKWLDDEVAKIEKVLLIDSFEIELAKHLIRYGEAVTTAVADYRPNYLTAYLYDLAQKFNVFYANCHVIGASPDKRPTRLLLCDLTAKTIEHGLHNLLGIEVIEQM
jgi:arginyl-tRNA synthetase